MQFLNENIEKIHILILECRLENMFSNKKFQRNESISSLDLKTNNQRQKRIKIRPAKKTFQNILAKIKRIQTTQKILATQKSIPKYFDNRFRILPRKYVSSRLQSKYIE